MTRWVAFILIGAAAAAQAGPPAALGRAGPGQWEISGTPQSRAPVRQCIGNVVTLVQYEHRGTACGTRVIRDAGNRAVVDYRCSPRDFGRSSITAITPRSFRIETQGISGGLPFNYVLQARRIGNCPAER